MSDIIETYQQEQKQLSQPEMPGMAFAAVIGVNEDGLELQFDGEETASTKRFPCNTGVSFAAGQRVLLMKVNGSYVALCPVGLQGGGGGGYLTPEDVVDSLTSTATDKPLSANQGKVLNDKIKTVSSENKSTNFSSINAQSGRTGYISAPSGAVGVTAYSNNGNVAVSAYLSGSYCYYALHNFSTSSQSGTIYFTFTKVT